MTLEHVNIFFRKAKAPLAIKKNLLQGMFTIPQTFPDLAPEHLIVLRGFFYSMDNFTSPTIDAEPHRMREAFGADIFDQHLLAQ